MAPKLPSLPCFEAFEVIFCPHVVRTGCPDRIGTRQIFAKKKCPDRIGTRAKCPDRIGTHFYACIVVKNAFRDVKNCHF